MLKVSLKNITLGGVDFSGEVSPEEFELQSFSEDEATFNDKIFYNLHISQVSGGILVAGSVKTNVSTICGRCLEKYEMQIEIADVCHFYEDAADINELDLAPELREDILLKLPMKYLCSKECKGISINKLHIKKSQEFEAELLNENNPWKELDSLKNL